MEVGDLEVTEEQVNFAKLFLSLEHLQKDLTKLEESTGKQHGELMAKIEVLEKKVAVKEVEFKAIVGAAMLMLAPLGGFLLWMAQQFFSKQH